MVLVHKEQGQMSEEYEDMNKDKSLTDVIRSEFGSSTNRRFLARMKAFKLEAEVPDQFRALLNRLDSAERSS